MPTPDIKMPENFLDIGISFLVRSQEWIEHEEFADVFPDGAEAADAYVKAMEAAGQTPETFMELPEEERALLYEEALVEATAQCLTPEFLEEVSEALGQLATRLEQEGQRRETIQARVLRDILKKNKEETTLLAHVGLLQALVHRATQLQFSAFRLMEEFKSKLNLTENPFTQDPEALIEQLRALNPDSEIFQELERRVEGTPELSRFLARWVDQIHEDGIRAIRTGELVLHVFDDTELDQGIEIFASMEDAQPTPEELAENIKKLIAFLETLFAAPERRTRLLSDLQSQSKTVASSYVAFLMQLVNDLTNMAPDEPLQGSPILHFLVTDLLVEMARRAQNQSQGNGKSE